jgi:hypothetical protein
MTITEATAVNVVLTYVLAAKQAFDVIGVHPELPTDVAGSAAHLAEKAHKALQCGLDGTQVREMWDGARIADLRVEPLNKGGR